MTAMKPFMETLPPEVDLKLTGLKPAGEEVLIQVATDMADRASFEKRWLVVTGQRLVLLHANGGNRAMDGGGPNEGNDTVHVPMGQMKTARVEALVGGGRLEVERHEGQPEYLYYSNSMAPKFAEVAEGIKQLVGGEDLAMPTELERSRCPKCQRMLPEKDGVCPACAKKLDTLRRLLAYFAPYRARVTALLIVLVAEALVDLLPPLITQHIIDDVLTPAAHYDLLVWLVLALLGINVLRWGTWVTRRWLGTTVGFRAIQAMRAELYKALQYLPLRFYDKRKVGSLISRMSNDSDLVEIYLIFDIPYVISNGVMVVGIIGLLFSMNWELTLFVLLPVQPIILGSSLIWKRMEAYWQRW